MLENKINHKQAGLFYFKACVLGFLAAWFAIAGLTNIFDLAFKMDLLSSSWSFRSNNFLLVASSLSVHHTPLSLVYLSFILITLVQCFIAILFFVAFIKYLMGKTDWRLINWSFITSIALWSMFIIMEEIFIAYAFEGGHRQLLILEVFLFLALHWLPEENRKPAL